MNQQYQFKGFTLEAIQFLRDVRFYNSRSWYEEHKPDYRRLLLTPFQNLVGDLSGFMLSIDPQFITTPAVDKTISRIYRDTRFSKDKSLYRDSMWFTFKRPAKDWKEVPVYFFELTPEAYRYGMGFYTAPKPYMDKFRERIKAKPEQFLEVVSFLERSNAFVVEGERYKKYHGGDLPDELRDWFQFKSFSIIGNHQIDQILLSEQLTGELRAGFGMIAPLYDYLWGLLE